MKQLILLLTIFKTYFSTTASVGLSALSWTMSWDSTYKTCNISASGTYTSTLAADNHIGISIIAQAANASAGGGDQGLFCQVDYTQTTGSTTNTCGFY